MSDEEPPRTEIVPTTEMDIVSPASAEKILDAFKAFEWMKENIITSNDRQKIGDTSFIKKSGWMKIALACNISLEKREERVEKVGEETVYHYTYRAVAPSGRFADADASASSGERKFTHLPHDIRSLAQTRACNRAVSNLVGGGEVSAEEMQNSSKEPSTYKEANTENPSKELVSDFDEPTPDTDTPVSVTDAIEGVGSDIKDGDLEVTLSKDGKTKVQPTKYLPTHVWNALNQALWKAGLSWTKNGKAGYWSGVLKE